MGCVSSKHVIRYFSSPLYDSSSLKPYDQNRNHTIQPLTTIKMGIQDDDNIHKNNGNGVVIDDPNGEPSICDSINLSFGRLAEAENVTAVWPSWLTAVAGDAIDGWLPLNSNNFQRLEKIGQGAYSSVYRARHNESGRIFALKKVQFNNLKPESVKFMAREITILRRLDHPNIMKLEGIIASRLSSNIYFVFEYMEHDLSGLLSCPDIKLSDSQIKCYLQQLLKGIEYCHSLGILHRDIKPANILVNNKGILKIGDFGLAKCHGPESREPLTSHVVTLWYRPPELLLGCTKYGMHVDLWSVGCVFAELFLGRPILKGRTEVEQLHKILKLCGTPPDDYWNKGKLPLATMFKPHHAYESSLRERCKQLPPTAVDLINTLLSIDPCKRGTAASALESEYFNTKSYACDPKSLPKYPPNKEIHAKGREDARRKKPGGVVWTSGASRSSTRFRKTCQEQTKVVPTDAHIARRNNGGGGTFSKASRYTGSDFSQTTQGSQSEGICALPSQATDSNGGFMWATKRQKHGGNYAESGGPMAVHVIYPSTSQPVTETGESSSIGCSGFRNPGSFDSSKVDSSQDLPTDDEETFYDTQSHC